jgi:hypothetical protein
LRATAPTVNPNDAPGAWYLVEWKLAAAAISAPPQIKVREYGVVATLGEANMLLNLSHIGQIGLAVSDVDRAEKFYETVIGLRKLYRFGDLTFFDCDGVRLLLEKTRDGSQPRQGGQKFPARPRPTKYPSFPCSDGEQLHHVERMGHQLPAGG